MKALCRIPGVGKSMAEKLEELITTGTFHPTGRILHKREPYEVDIDAVVAAARETGTVLELDAYPELRRRRA